MVGYTVRFTHQTTDRTLVKLMTDGILLAEIQRDRRLLRYDTLILDEAHERSLNIDFLIGYLRQLLPRRPDLKVIVTSATIEPQRFAKHFAASGADAPIVEVSGRGYPVEIRYRPLELPAAGPMSGDGGDESQDPDDPDHEVVRVEPRDQTEAIIDALAELSTEPPGDVLVFLSGEREIRDTAEAVRAAMADAEVLPLYARLPTADQQKVFKPNPSRLHRRIVLATNCRRDVADGSGDPLRHRPGYRPDIPLQQADESATAADRADFAGLRRPAGRALRAYRAGNLHPALLRTGSRGPAPLHRPGDPADQPRLGDPADGRAAAW